MSSSSSGTPRRRPRRRRGPPPPRPPWIDLPSEVTAEILHKLGAIEILESAQKVCTTWRKICKDPAMWRVIDMRNLGELWCMPYDLVKMCCHAVDRSQGQLLDINIEYFGNDDLLAYIAERSGQLRRLRIVSGNGVSDEGLSQAVKMFPLLEELHIYFTTFDIEAITAIGNSCPLLKSFKLNEQGYKHPHIEYDEEALAIAASMPKLCHLQLFGNKMTNQGLTAILDGCPLLETLDLCRCFNVNLDGNLGTRCSQQMKDLRLPDDSADDYSYMSGNDYDWDSLREGNSFRYSDTDLAYEEGEEEEDSSYASEFSDTEGVADYEFLSDF